MADEDLPDNLHESSGSLSPPRTPSSSGQSDGAMDFRVCCVFAYCLLELKRTRQDAQDAYGEEDDGSSRPRKRFKWEKERTLHVGKVESDEDVERVRLIASKYGLVEKIVHPAGRRFAFMQMGSEGEAQELLKRLSRDESFPFPVSFSRNLSVLNEANSERDKERGSKGSDRPIKLKLQSVVRPGYRDPYFSPLSPAYLCSHIHLPV